MARKNKWFFFNGITVNVNYIVSFTTKDDDKIRIYFASGTSLISTDITYPTKEDRDEAFEQMNECLQ